jgi:hypothetical protein
MRSTPRFAVALLTAVAIAAGFSSPASADAPNVQGQVMGDAAAAPVSPAYDAPRPAGAGTGRKVG